MLYFVFDTSRFDLLLDCFRLDDLLVLDGDQILEQWVIKVNCRLLTCAGLGLVSCFSFPGLPC
jgi:hypothetical protein